ncbi:hypothetical protein R3P38DRAFT_2764026 [Favolaschia claudopus]|uniref:Uncharacterized protein n=1 Tax=Favolaschia claudopus TaxID=2862362 RepID=A0AAW0DE15_9AGAR
MGRWGLVGADKPKETRKKKEDIPSNATGRKRKQSTGDVDDPSPVKRLKTLNKPPPKGIAWDADNYSCAYDALFTCLLNIWLDHDSLWTVRFGTVGIRMKRLAEGFTKITNKTGTLENARDQVRHEITAVYPDQFPVGPEFTVLDNLTQVMFKEKFWGTRTTPPILYFNVHDNNIKLDHELRVTVKGVPITYMLRGSDECLMYRMTVHKYEFCRAQRRPSTPKWLEDDSSNFGRIEVFKEQFSRYSIVAAMACCFMLARTTGKLASPSRVERAEQRSL